MYPTTSGWKADGSYGGRAALIWDRIRAMCAQLLPAERPMGHMEVGQRCVAPFVARMVDDGESPDEPAPCGTQLLPAVEPMGRMVIGSRQQSHRRSID